MHQYLTNAGLTSAELKCIPASALPILVRLQMNTAPVLGNLTKDDLPSLGALGHVSKLKAFAN